MGLLRVLALLLLFGVVIGKELSFESSLRFLYHTLLIVVAQSEHTVSRVYSLV